LARDADFSFEVRELLLVEHVLAALRIHDAARELKRVTEGERAHERVLSLE
jgi:hypothetical protein